MVRRLATLLGLVVVMVVAGCAQLPKQAFNREGARHVKSVAIVRMDNQETYEAVMLGHPGMGFGLIGGLVAAADMQAKSNRLTAALDPKETRLQERFAERLATALQGAGYATSFVDVPKATPEAEVHPFVRKNTQAEAFILVRLVGAYYAAGPSTDYQPRLLGVVKVVDLATGSPLYQDSLTYGYAIPQAQTIHFAADAKYRFADMDVLTKDPATSREGLYAGMDVLAGQIASDLKRN